MSTDDGQPDRPRSAALERIRALPSAAPAPRAPGVLAAALEGAVVGLERPLRRILETLVIAQEPAAPPLPALLLVGPAGTGKRTLVRAIAAACGRFLARIAPPGVGDAGLAGRARAEGGRGEGEVALALEAAGTRAPVLWLDGVDAREDDAAAEGILDPERRAAFHDHGLDASIDLSRALVVATARHPSRIPDALRRHAQEVRLPGYAREEKLDILARALLPHARAALGERAAALDVAPEARALLASAYSPGPGVHDLARRTQEVLRRALAAVLLGEAGASSPIDAAALDRLLGPPPAAPLPRRIAEVGVSTGITWGADGAVVALVEAIRDGGGAAPSHRSGGSRRDAAEAAMAYVHGRADRLRIDPGAIREGGFRLRVSGPAPQGDDDGNDLAVLLALVSLATDRPVRPDVALAGALTLRGAVRPTAGVAEKVLAAARGGARRVLVPAQDLPLLQASLAPQALAAIDVVPVAHADEAVREALIDIVIAREVR